jgi:rhamnogalacturonyl hydrolase YesR
MHLRRLWGAHELTGRRLYLSIWNLAEVWDATKDPRYGGEARERVDRMLRLQFEQGGALTLDRYGYAQIYATHGLSRYYAMTGDPKVRQALVRHARFVRDVPPLNHWMESYYSSIHSLALAYELTGEPSFLAETRKRVADMRTDPLPRPMDDSWTQQALSEAYEAASHLPPDPNRHRPPTGRGQGGARAVSPLLGDGGQAAAFGSPRRPGWSPTNGLRIFGWTHAYTLPYALAILQPDPSTPAAAAGASTRK